MGRYFGTDGIRGVAFDTLTRETVSNIGNFVGNYFKGGRIVIGMDTRESSNVFEIDLASSISKQGCDVYLIGYCSTPCLAYTTMHEKFSIGIMISASHNPYTDNGIKIFANDGLKINDELESKIEDYIDEPIAFDLSSSGKVIEYKQAIDHYQDWLLDSYRLDMGGMRILVDLANGSNCFMAKPVFAQINVEAEYINDSPNGTNINNHCGSTHLEMLSEKVKAGNYALGLAFDGDADRVLFTDEDGILVDGDQIMYLLAKYLKENNLLENDTLVTTVMSNIGLYKSCEKIGIKNDIVPVGDKNVTDSLLNNHFSIGGEQSGHIIYAGDCFFGDGLKTALLLFKALNSCNVSLKQAVKEVTIYPQLLVNVKVKDKKIVLNDQKINESIKEISDKLADEGRILVRPSGTEPLIRVMVEAKSQQLCHDYVYSVIDLIKELGYSA